MLGILKRDPGLLAHEKALRRRVARFQKKKRELLAKHSSLSDFANGSLYFGFHRNEKGIVYREWAPGADRAFLVGDWNRWQENFPMEKKEHGVFEILLPPETPTGGRVRVVLYRNGERMERIPLYAKEVIQDEKSGAFFATLRTEFPYSWKCTDFVPQKPLFVYECHVGMAQEEGRVSSYREFTEKTLPRIRDAGYTAIQLMAIMEHPYYASFGYQVSSFFAASSRFGTPEDLKELIDTAHQMGIAVFLDLVHSHAVKNTDEGIYRFDGTEHQFFHVGERGHHPAWDTKLFDYGKNQVLHFLLSNLKFWLTEYRFDGFRFDGVTSMLYKNHGLGQNFTDYSMYFSENTDEEALLYLQLATELVRELSHSAILICEEMSGMPGMCLPVREGGVGFDYRLAMGVPDFWIRLLKNQRDEEWSVGEIWYELTRRRKGEKNLGYAESHDQALVGDQTLMFRLCDKEMYTGMEKNSQNHVIDRGMALHKMIRLITLSLAGEGYLNFMGNEFGHPEWIDFPREGNGWSYHYCRRQWHLADEENLRYRDLMEFDREMLRFAKNARLFDSKAALLSLQEEEKILVFRRTQKILAFNFHPTLSQTRCFIPTAKSGTFRVTLTTDEKRFGGWDRISTDYLYRAKKQENGKIGFFLYLPARSAVCLELWNEKKER